MWNKWNNSFWTAVIMNFIRRFSSRVENYLIFYFHASNISLHWKREFLSPCGYEISFMYQANMGHFEVWHSLMKSMQLMLEFTGLSRVKRKALWLITERFTRIQRFGTLSTRKWLGSAPLAFALWILPRVQNNNNNTHHHHHHHHHYY